MTQRAPFVIDPQLTSIVMAYRNTSFIADQVLPRVTVNRKDYKYKLWDKPEAFDLPNTRVGRTSAPNQVEFQGSEATGSVSDYGLDDPIPYEDIQNASPGSDPRAHAAETLADLIALGREKRVADLVMATGTYAAANKTTLSGGTQWSAHSTSTPIADIMTGLDACIMRPNTLVMSRAVARQLRTHPQICKAAHGNSGDAGIIPIRALEDMFELRIFVGETWYNSAAKGQTATYAQLWPKYAALLHINPNVRNVNGNAVSFGWTAQYGDRVSGSIEDRDIGLRGGVRVRVGESVGEKIAAADVGYLIIDAVA